MTRLRYRPDAAWRGAGRWIGLPSGGTDPNRWFRAYRVFFLDSAPVLAELRVTADSHYQVKLNGAVVGDGPVRGTRSLHFFDVYDVADLLAAGENRIEALVQNMNIPTYLAAPVEAALRLELESGTEMLLASDALWRVAAAPDWRSDVAIHTFQTGYSEWRDYAREPAFGQNAVPARELPPDSPLYARELRARDAPPPAERQLTPSGIPVLASTPPLADPEDPEIARLATEEPHAPGADRVAGAANLLRGGGDAPARILPAPGGAGVAMVFDFGSEVVGRYAIDLDAPAGTIVDVCCEEELWNGRLRGRHDRGTHFYNFVDRFLCAGGRQTVGTTLHTRGFRMLQVNFRRFFGEIRLFSVRGADARYPFVERGRFACGDSRANRIRDIAVETLRACATDVFIDCPWRERAFWVNDLLVQNAASLAVFGAEALHRRAFALALSQSRPDGLIDGVCPCGRENGLSLVATNLFLPLMLEEYLLHSGDAETPRRAMGDIARILDAFHGWTDDRGLVIPPRREGVWNFFDWSYGMNGRTFEGRPTSMLNLLYVLALQKTLSLGGFLHMPLPEAEYRKRLARAREAAFSAFGRPDGYLADTLDDDGRPHEWVSELPHALALLTGPADARERDGCMRALTAGPALATELYLHYFILPALASAGRPEEAYRRILKHWGAMVDAGAPTLWEAGVHQKGKAAFGGAGSLCHGFSASPVLFFASTILGVRPLTPGFGRFLVDPRPCGLSFASGRIPAPGGDIEIAWRAEPGGLAIDLRHPIGTAAVLPDGREFSGQSEISSFFNFFALDKRQGTGYTG